MITAALTISYSLLYSPFLRLLPVAFATAATGLTLCLCRRSVLLFRLLRRRLSLLNLRRYRPRLRLCLSRRRLNRSLLVFRPAHHLRRTRLRTLDSRRRRSGSSRLRLNALRLRPHNFPARLSRRGLTHTLTLSLLGCTMLSLLLLPLLLLQLALCLAVSTSGLSCNFRINLRNLRDVRAFGFLNPSALAFVPDVQLLTLHSIRNRLGPQTLCQIFTKRRGVRRRADDHRCIVQLLRYAGRQINLAPAPC